MKEVHYGVIQREGAWAIIGSHLRVGRYDTRVAAERAARKLAAESLGVTVQLHIQDESGELRPPDRIAN